jgi:hypothetical protein
MVSGSIPSGVTLRIFSVATDGTMCPGVNSSSKNGSQGFSLGVKGAGAWGWRRTALVVPNVKKIRGLNLPGTPLGPCGLLWAWPLLLLLLLLLLLRSLAVMEKFYVIFSTFPSLSFVPFITLSWGTDKGSHFHCYIRVTCKLTLFNTQFISTL